MGEELESITLRAGMDPLRVAAHINGNFANYPALASIEFGALRLIDVYNMEGAVNEHVTSTGLNDCETVYWNCHDEHGVKTCNSQLIIPSKDHDTARFSRNIKDCNLHNGERDKTFDGLWRKFLGAQTTYKVNGKRWVTHLGLESAEAKNEFPVNDFNGIGGGTISGAFGFLIDACITCDSSVAARDPWTGSPYAIESEALYKWNKDRVFPPGFKLDGANNPARVQWHLGPSIKDRDEDGVSCDDVCASLAFDGRPQVCVEDWKKTGKGNLLGQPRTKRGMSIVGRQAGFECHHNSFKATSIYGPIADLRDTGVYPLAICHGVHPKYVKKVNCQTRQPKTEAGLKVCPCKPVDATGYGHAKNTASKRRKLPFGIQLPQLPQFGIR